MAVHPVADSIARSVPPPPPRLVPTPARSARRLRLLDAIVEVGCEIISLAAASATALVTSRAHDAEADRHVATIRRQARLGAEESAGVYGCPCWRRFVVIDQHGAAYTVADDREDGCVESVRGVLARIAQIARGLNRRLTLELAKRGGRK